MLYKRKLKTIEEKSKEIEHLSSENQNKMDNLILEKQQIESEIQKLQLQTNEYNGLSQEQDVDVQDIFENTIFGQENIQFQNEKIQEGQKNFQKNLKRDQKNAQQVDEIKQQIQQISQEVNKLMLQRYQVENQINMQSFKTMNKNQKENIIKSNKKQIDTFNQEIEQLNKQNEEIQNDISTMQENIDKQQKTSQKFCEKIEKEYQKMNLDKEELNKLANQQQNFKMKLKKQENTVKILQQTISKKLQQLAKKRGSNNLSQLMIILEEYKKKGTKGQVDFLINCIDFPKSMNIPIEALFYKDLFTIIVEQQEDAQNLINLNEQKKGGKIKILPIKWIKQNKNLINTTVMNNSFSFQKDSIVKIKDYITLKQNCKFEKSKIEILLDQIFGNSVYVKNRENALKIAKEENLNAVTQEGEVFYAGAYLGKVGRFQIENSKLNLYQEIEELKNQNFDNDKNEIFQQKEKVENEIKKFQENLQKSQNFISQIESNYNQVKISIKNKQNQLINLTKSLFNNKNLIDLKNETLQNLNNYKQQNSQENSQKKIDYSKFQNQIQKIDEKIAKKNQENENLKEKLQSLLEYKQKESLKLSQNIKRSKSPKLRKRQFSNNSANNEEKEAQQKNDKKIQNLQKNKNQIQNEIDQLKNTQYEYQGKLQGLTLQILDVKNKIYNFQTSQQNEQDEKSTKQLMEKLKKLIQKTKNTFSDKDQVAFHKLRDLNKKEKDFEEQLDSIEGKKETLLKCFEETVEERKNNFFRNFKKNFEKIYRTYEPLWKVKVLHVKKQDENNEDFDTLEFQLDPRNSEQENQLFERKVFNRASLSMGKKVIFGLCFLLALQKIEKVFQKVNFINT